MPLARTKPRYTASLDKGGQTTKDKVNYRQSFERHVNCGGCRFFVEPNACTLVAGRIDADDVCDLFVPVYATEKVVVVGELTRVQRVIMILMAMEAKDEAELREHLYLQALADYAAYMRAEAQAAGYTVAHVVANEVIQNALLSRAGFASSRMADTFNRDLEKQIWLIGQEVPTANRNVYAKRLLDWEDARIDQRVVGQAVTEGSVTHALAQEEFWDRNNIEGALARFRPGTAAEPICQALVDKGWISMKEARAQELPVHINCPHYLEVDYSSCTKLQKGEVRKAEPVCQLPPDAELDVGGERVREAKEFEPGKDGQAERDAYMKERMPMGQPEDMFGKAGTPGVPWTEQELKALNTYTETGYRDMNAYLRGGDFGAEAEALLVANVSSVQSALRRAETAEDMIVYRAISNAPRDMLEHLDDLVGSIIDDPGFLSTTLDSGFAADWVGNGDRGLLLEIFVPGGTNGYYVGGREAELLLQSGTRLRVMEVTSVPRAAGFEFLGPMPKLILEVIP